MAVKKRFELLSIRRVKKKTESNTQTVVVQFKCTAAGAAAHPCIMHTAIQCFDQFWA